MWGERRPNVFILECFNCSGRVARWERWEGGEVGKMRKVGGWWSWEGGKGDRVVRWESGRFLALKVSRVVMKKNGEATEGRGSIVKCGKMLHEGKACENPVGWSSVWRSYKNCWIHLVNIWWMLDWMLSQNCRNTLSLHTVDQLASSAKSDRLL